jgi:Na+/H+ antiporter NhaA/glutaredoxin
VLLYLAVNRGGPGAHGWGTAMSTDTALALGLLAVLGKRVPDKVRVFLLTVFIVDDLVALVVIAVAYSARVRMLPLAVAVAVFAVLVALRVVWRLRRGPVYLALGVVAWVALLSSGVDPVVVGLATGLVTSAYTPARGDLERASGLFRLYREQPTPELARDAVAGLAASQSPNARLQEMFHRSTSFVIVPLFALANAGIAIDGHFLVTAFTSPVTVGVLLGYLVGKPLAVAGTSALVAKVTGGRLRPQVGWAAVLGSGTTAGIGFTVSLLVASLALHGPALAEAKLGVLTAAAVASLLTWGVYRVTALLPADRRALALLGRTDELVDLVSEVDPERDHIRGPERASVTVVEYGDFQCPYCGQAEPAVAELLHDPDVRYVWRHLPLTDVHPQAELAAEAAEAAGAQGRFWEMHDLLLAHQDALRPADLLRYADQLGLDRDRFHDDLRQHAHAARIAQDVESADLSGVSGTPTLFVNDQRYYGAFDEAALVRAVKLARTRARIAS